MEKYFSYVPLPLAIGINFIGGIVLAQAVGAFPILGLILGMLMIYSNKLLFNCTLPTAKCSWSAGLGAKHAQRVQRFPRDAHRRACAPLSIGNFIGRYLKRKPLHHALRGPPPLIAALKGRLGRCAPSANATLTLCDSTS